MSKKILLVDIDDNLQEAFTSLLDKLFEGKQYNLFHVKSVQKALDILKKDNIDLIITDLQLLDRSGISLLIQVNNAYPNIPKIVLSAYTDIVSEEDLKLLGVKYFFQKPPDLSTLRSGIEQIFQLKKEENME
ncbi:MAG: response regulator [Bacteroidetes bacterium]|nr:response regulator [Bacteroidota bacterium]MCH8325285.1 response regulator [Bacteroidota bacterium]